MMGTRDLGELGGGGLGGNSLPVPVSPQAPAGQRPLPAPGLPEGAPAPGPARCCALGQQASEELWGEAPGKPAAPMAFNVVQRERPSNRRKRHFFQAMTVASSDCGSRGSVASRLKNQSPSPWKPAAVMLGPGSSFTLPCTASDLLRAEASNTGETTGRNGRADAFLLGPVPWRTCMISSLCHIQCNTLIFALYAEQGFSQSGL